MLKKLCLFTTFGTINAMACTTITDLTGGLNIRQFQQCQTQLKKCPTNGPFLAQTCIEKTLQNEPACQQLKTISGKAAVDANLIQAKAFHSLTLLTLNYPADGKQSYQVITPTGCIISLQWKTNSTSQQFAVPVSPPSYQQQQSGEQQFVLRIAIKKGCMACETLSYQTVRYRFNRHGEYLGVVPAEHKNKEDD